MVTETVIEILSNISILLLIGLIFSIIAKKFQISNILLLVIVGVIIGNLSYHGTPLIEFSSVFLVSIAVITLVMVVFDGSSRFELRMVNLYSLPALRVTLLFFLFNIFLVTMATQILFFEEFSSVTILFSLLFSFLMSGTDPASVFIMLKSKTNKVIEFLEVEAIINTPIMVIFPFIIFDILNNIGGQNVGSAIVGQITPFFQQIVVGVGCGVIIGIIVFKSMKKIYSHSLSPVAIFTAALISYIASENLSGNGVLSVATLGLFFGNMYVKEKESLQEFNAGLSNSLTILVFILLGLMIKVDFSFVFMAKALVVFFVMVISRMGALGFALPKSDFNIKERIFMAVSMPKGIAVAVVAFSLSVLPMNASFEPLRHIVLQLIIIGMIYSLVFSSIIDRFSQKFIRVKLTK